jgi:hypothetical protein
VDLDVDVQVDVDVDVDVDDDVVDERTSRPSGPAPSAPPTFDLSGRGSG